MANASIEIKGFKRLDKKLSRLPKRVERKVIVQAARPAGHMVANVAKGLAPKQSGEMAKTIGVRVKKGKPPGIVVRTATRERLGIAPEDPWYYPAIVEYGAPGRNIPASRFMHRAKEQAGRAAIGVFVRNLWAGVKAEASKK